jgi:hypothetical protein
MTACRVFVRGKAYPSIKAAARALRVSERTLYRHLDRFGHLDRIGKPGRPRPDLSKSVTLGPYTFPSVTAAAAALGLDRKTIRNTTRSDSARATVLKAVMQYSLKETVR